MSLTLPSDPVDLLIGVMLQLLSAPAGEVDDAVDDLGRKLVSTEGDLDAILFVPVGPEGIDDLPLLGVLGGGGPIIRTSLFSLLLDTLGLLKDNGN